jgi:hypothetical protein
MNFSNTNPIPPRSLVKLVKADESCPNWKSIIGCVFRIGYYSKQDGFDFIPLVDDEGNYSRSTDHDYLNRYFEVVEVSDETDFHGVERDTLKPLKLN